MYTPIDANGQIAVDYATPNQVPGIYGDGLAAQVNTGLAINLLGDQNTGMGTSGYQVQDSGDRGAGLFYYDQNLPANSTGSGLTTEFWFLYDGAGNAGTTTASTATTCTLMTMYGAPSSFKAPTGSGNGAIATVYATGYSGTAWSSGIGGTITVLGPAGATLNFPFTPNASNPQHMVITMSTSNGLSDVYFNGVSQGQVTLGVMTEFAAVALGPSRYSYDCANAYVYEAYNYVAAHLAIYAYQLTAERIAAHYTTGALGASGVTAAERFAQILTWGGLGPETRRVLVAGRDRAAGDHPDRPRLLPVRFVRRGRDQRGRAGRRRPVEHAGERVLRVHRTVGRVQQAGRRLLR